MLASTIFDFGGALAAFRGLCQQLPRDSSIAVFSSTAVLALPSLGGPEGPGRTGRLALCRFGDRPAAAAILGLFKPDAFRPP